MVGAEMTAFAVAGADAEIIRDEDRLAAKEAIERIMVYYLDIF